MSDLIDMVFFFEYVQAVVLEFFKIKIWLIPEINYQLTQCQKSILPSKMIKNAKKKIAEIVVNRVYQWMTATLGRDGLDQR